MYSHRKQQREKKNARIVENEATEKCLDVRFTFNCGEFLYIFLIPCYSPARWNFFSLSHAYKFRSGRCVGPCCGCCWWRCWCAADVVFEWPKLVRYDKPHIQRFRLHAVSRTHFSVCLVFDELLLSSSRLSSIVQQRGTRNIILK